jgi:hypothetical protein
MAFRDICTDNRKRDFVCFDNAKIFHTINELTMQEVSSNATRKI